MFVDTILTCLLSYFIYTYLYEVSPKSARPDLDPGTAADQNVSNTLFQVQKLSVKLLSNSLLEKVIVLKVLKIGWMGCTETIFRLIMLD